MMEIVVSLQRVERNPGMESCTDCVKFVLDSEQTHKIRTRKIIAGSSLEEVMEENVSIPIWVPADFLTFAREMIKKFSEEMPYLPFNDCLKSLNKTYTCKDYAEKLILINLNFSPETMFQQIDRRMDE
jgi:hypothetical protein